MEINVFLIDNICDIIKKNVNKDNMGMREAHMVPFNRPPCVGTEIKYIEQAIKSERISGDGVFTKKCSALLESKYDLKKILLTTSCTHALEMAAILANIQPGDEVIMPSFTFVSTANAFVRLGARIVFVDIRPDTLNIDEHLIEEAITSKTKAIVPVHYAGVSCEMDAINEIAQGYQLKVIEDAAQGVNAFYKGRALGSLGDMGCYSFHETKNYSMGEGGAIILNHPADIDRAEIIREKGTNRSRFFRGEVDKYTWVDCGSSYLPSELNVAYLYGQLLEADKINEERLALWHYYHEQLEKWEKKGRLLRPQVPKHCKHNAHLYTIRVENLQERTRLLAYLKEREIGAIFHYIPLHSSTAGKQYGVFRGKDQYTTKESERLIRLPLFYGMSMKEIEQVVTAIGDYFRER